MPDTMPFEVVAFYPAQFAPEIDRAIEQAVGRRVDASRRNVGPWGNQRRDLIWYCLTKADAERIATKAIEPSLLKQNPKMLLPEIKTKISAL